MPGKIVDRIIHWTHSWKRMRKSSLTLAVNYRILCKILIFPSKFVTCQSEKNPPVLMLIYVLYVKVLAISDRQRKPPTKMMTTMVMIRQVMTIVRIDGATTKIIAVSSLLNSPMFLSLNFTTIFPKHPNTPQKKIIIENPWFHKMNTVPSSLSLTPRSLTTDLQETSTDLSWIFLSFSFGLKNLKSAKLWDILHWVSEAKNSFSTSRYRHSESVERSYETS